MSGAHRRTSPTTPIPRCSHFSLSNPRGEGQGDLPLLLRNLATEIENLEAEAMILDVAISQETDDLGEIFTATVYFEPDGWRS